MAAAEYRRGHAAHWVNAEYEALAIILESYRTTTMDLAIIRYQ